MPVAVKVLDAELVDGPDARGRFLRERSVLSAVNHPNVLGVRDLVVEGETAGIVMELVTGTDLRRHLSARTRLAPAEACAVAADIAAGSPRCTPTASCTVTSSPRTCSSTPRTGESPHRFRDRPSHRHRSLTRQPRVVGTPAYVAPEVAEGDEPGPKADVYALGTVLYELLSGRPPFVGPDALAVLRSDADAARPGGLPNDLWDVLTACLGKDPPSRPAPVTLAKALSDLSRRLAAVSPLAPADLGGADTTSPPVDPAVEPAVDGAPTVEHPTLARRSPAPPVALTAVPRRGGRRRLPLVGAAVLAAVLLLAWTVGGGRDGRTTRSAAQTAGATLDTTTSASVTTTVPLQPATTEARPPPSSAVATAAPASSTTTRPAPPTTPRRRWPPGRSPPPPNRPPPRRRLRRNDAAHHHHRSTRVRGLGGAAGLRGQVPRRAGAERRQRHRSADLGVQGGGQPALALRLTNHQRAPPQMTHAAAARRSSLWPAAAGSSTRSNRAGGSSGRSIGARCGYRCPMLRRSSKARARR